MLRLNCLLAACVLALAINVGAAEATGHGAGGWHGAGGRHVVARHGRGHRGRHFGSGYYGYICDYYGGDCYGTPYYSNDPVGSESTPLPATFALPLPAALACSHSEEIITVPSGHGPWEVRITRC